MPELLKPPTITLAGLTSAGKTAFLRTFLRDSEIGQIHASAGTTGIIDDYPLYLDSDKDTLFVICDTPGFQNVRGLINLLNNRFPARDLETFSIQEISSLFPQGKDNPDAIPFRHDHLSWEQIQKSDTVLAVIDVTEDPDSGGPQKGFLSFWKLIQKEKPLVVILNKRHSAPNGNLLTQKWRSILEKECLEPIIEYDAHHRNMKAESAIFNFLADLYPPLRRRFMRKKERRLSEGERQHQNAIRETANYLLKLAKTRVNLGKGKEAQNRFESEKAEKQLVDKLRCAEKDFVKTITSIYGFDPSIVSDAGNFNICSHRLEESLGKQRVATGAAVGAIIDIPFGGLSLGAGSLIGAATGAFVGKTYDMIVKRWRSSSGKAVFFIPDIKFLDLAIDRSLGILQSLELRGHGTPNETTIKLGGMPVISISSAIGQLQKIATADWTSRLLHIPSAAFDKIRKFTSVEYTERSVEQLSKTLNDYLSAVSSSSDTDLLPDRSEDEIVSY